MGLWDKLKKGVFGRIKGFGKKVINWIKDHKSTIEKVVNTAKEVLPENVKKYVERGEEIYKKGEKYYDKYGKLIGL